MPLLRGLAAGLLFRRLARALDRHTLALDAQTEALVRLADRYAPRLPVDSPGDRATVRADTGVSHLDVDDAALALDYMARTQRDTGHVPDEDEVLIYLADEKTVDLHARLAARDTELERLMEARR